MPAPVTLPQLQANADQATAALAAAQQRIAEARAEVREAAEAHRNAIFAATEPQPTPDPAAPAAKGKAATTAASSITSIDATDQRLKKALADYQQVCRDLGV